MVIVYLKHFQLISTITEIVPIFFFFFLTCLMYVLQTNMHHIKFIMVNVPSKWMDILNLTFITTFWVYDTWIIWFVDNIYDTFIMLLWCFPDMLELDRHHTQFTFIKWTRTAGIFFKYSPFGLCWRRSVIQVWNVMSEPIETLNL